MRERERERERDAFLLPITNVAELSWRLHLVTSYVYYNKCNAKECSNMLCVEILHITIQFYAIFSSAMSFNTARYKAV